MSDLVSDVIDPIWNKQVKQATVDLQALNDVALDTLKGMIAIRNATAGSNTFAELNTNTQKAATAQKNLADTTEKTRNVEAKLDQEREKAYSRYLQRLAKEQSEQDKANQKAQTNLQIRLDNISKEEAALEALAAKKARLNEDDERFHRSSFQSNETYQVGPSTPTNSADNTAIADAGAAQNSQSATIASIGETTEAINQNTAAKIANAEATEASNAALIEYITFNNQLKVELAIVNDEIKQKGTFDAELTAQQLRLTQAIRDNNAVISQQIKLDNAAEGSNNEQRAQLEILRAEYNALTAAEKANIEVGGAKLAQIQKLGPAVAANAAELGKFGDNVGNYPVSAIDKVLGRFDSLDKIGARVLSNVARHALSFGTSFLIFSAASAAIDFLGKELSDLIEKYDLFGTKLTLQALNLKNFNEVTKAVSADLGKSQTTFKILTDTAENTALSLKERTDAGAELIKQFPKELEGATALGIANGEEKKQLDKLSISLIENARARAALNKIQELEAKIEEAEFQKVKIRNAEAQEIANVPKETSGKIGLGGVAFTQADQIGGAKKRANEANAIQAQNQKVLQDQIDFLIKFAGGEDKIAKVIETDDNKKVKKTPKIKVDNDDEQTLQKQAEYLKSQAQNDELSFKDREKAAKNYYDILNELAELQTKKAIAGKKDEDEAYSLEDANRVNAAAETAKLLTKINDEQIKANIAMLEKRDKDRIQALKTAGEQQLITVNEYEKSALEGEAKLYAEGTISTQQYNDQRTEITKQASDERLQVQLDALDKVLKYEEDNLEYSAEDEKAFNALKAQLIKQRGDNEIQQEEKKGALLDQIKKDAAARQTDYEIKGVELVKDAVEQGLQDRIDAQKQALTDQQNLLDQSTQSQIDAENKSLDSTQTKADKIAVINAKAVADKKIIDDQQAKLDQEAKKRQKEISAANILITAAETVFKLEAAAAVQAATFPLNPLGLIQAAATSAEIPFIVGAAIAQAAIVLAFEKGGVVPNDKPFLIGEKGAELMIDPTDGSYSLSPDRPTLMTAKPGTRIRDHETTTRILTRPDKVNYAGGEQISMREVERLLNKVAKNTEQQNSYKQISYPAHWNTDYFKSKIN